MSNYPRTKHCEWRARGFLTLKFLMVNMILLCIIFCDMGFQNFFQKELGTRCFLKTNTDLSGKNNYFIFDLVWTSDFLETQIFPKRNWLVCDKKELPDKNMPNRILDYHVWSSWRMTKISRHVSLQHFFCKVVMQEKSDFLSLSLSSKVKLLFLSSCWDGKKIYLTTILFPFETKENRTWGNNISHSKKKNCT